MGQKPLGVLKDIVESMGMGISYAYEDLVFLEHSAFILQFTDNDHEILVHINTEADMKELEDTLAKLNNAASGRGMASIIGKYFTLSQADDANIAIEFSEIPA
ncbi:MAG: hypothetical protein KQH63_13940 [Desulfobulbaceae bacterium]|nr:hypothetical protein [Desulfobulbaceae bacterium]